jgi:hypothetical protein
MLTSHIFISINLSIFPYFFFRTVIFSDRIFKKHKAKLNEVHKFVFESNIASLRDPLCDISNFESPAALVHSKVSNYANLVVNNVIPLDDADDDDNLSSLSPIPQLHPNMSAPKKVIS